MKLLSISDILKNEVIPFIDKNVKIDSFEDNGDGTFKLSSCDTKYLRPCKKIEINGEIFSIEKNTCNDQTIFVQDSHITLIPKNANFDFANFILTLPEAFEIYSPFFYHGSPINVNDSLVQVNMTRDKTPLIYLFETLKEKNYTFEGASPISLEADLIMFFIDENQFATWDVSKHYEDCVNPMKALAEGLVNVINKKRGDFAEVTEFETTPRVNFGKVVQNGVEKSFFDDQLSGTELRFTVQYKNFICKRGCL